MTIYSPINFTYMINPKPKLVLTGLILLSTLITCVNAAPVRFSHIVEIIDPRPEKGDTAKFLRIDLANNYTIIDNSDENQKNPIISPTPQDGRVIVITQSTIVEDESCACADEEVQGVNYAQYALFGFAAFPLLPALFAVTSDNNVQIPAAPNVVSPIRP